MKNTELLMNTGLVNKHSGGDGNTTLLSLPVTLRRSSLPHRHTSRAPIDKTSDHEEPTTHSFLRTKVYMMVRNEIN